jgi:hypothetical protein
MVEASQQDELGPATARPAHRRRGIAWPRKRAAMDGAAVLGAASIVMAMIGVVQMPPGEIMPEVLAATAAAGIDETPITVCQKAAV